MSFSFNSQKFSELNNSLNNSLTAQRSIVSGTPQIEGLGEFNNGLSGVSFSSQRSSVDRYGNSVVDVNSGSRYNKTVVTGTGSDYIRAGLGNDTVTGGAGADTFAFGSPSEGRDTITDFSVAQGDKIQVVASGFGISGKDFSRFSFNPTNNTLSFDTTAIATLPANSGFVPAVNINII